MFIVEYNLHVALFYVCNVIDMLVNKENGSFNKSVNERKMSSKLLSFFNYSCLCVCSLVFYVAFILDNSDSFMGDARRLSEAGVRRSSGWFCN